jgi:hypothetical protein
MLKGRFDAMTALKKQPVGFRRNHAASSMTIGWELIHSSQPLALNSQVLLVSAIYNRGRIYKFTGTRNNQKSNGLLLMLSVRVD